MTSILGAVGRLIRREQTSAPDADPRPEAGLSLAEPVEIAPNDPLIVYFQGNVGAVDIEHLSLESPGLEALREAGIKVVIPLVSQGELIGLINLGPRLSEQEYSSDDRRLLDNLASHVAPAVQVAQLVRRQEEEARERERVEQELRVAQIIQQNFLPKEAPDLPGWRLDAHYQPAREVGGDFYDFIPLADGKLGLVIGDVTDKGVPAALVMAATRSILRAAAQRLASPGEVLERANELLCPDIPPNMFATCLYGVLDPTSGLLRYANAGHNLPYLRTADGVLEMRATGMPLGLLPGMTYEENEATLAPGDCVLLHSDGLAEAHNPAREMFGFPRVMELTGARAEGGDLIRLLLDQLRAFSGEDAQLEDDVTLVTITREGTSANASSDDGDVLAEFTIASEPGNERLAIERVTEAVASLDLATSRLDRLKTAVGEATMNAMEHGNGYRSDLPVTIRVSATDDAVHVSVIDHGGAEAIAAPEAPDLDAKLSGDQSPRGWGIFLIQNMVDDVRTSSDGTLHTIELTLHREGDGHA